MRGPSCDNVAKGGFLPPHWGSSTKGNHTPPRGGLPLRGNPPRRKGSSPPGETTHSPPGEPLPTGGDHHTPHRESLSPPGEMDHGNQPVRLHTVPGTGTPHIQAYQPSARVIRPTYKGRGLDSKTRQGPPLFYNTTEPSHYREVGTFHPQGIRNHTPQGDSLLTVNHKPLT